MNAGVLTPDVSIYRTLYHLLKIRIFQGELNVEIVIVYKRKIHNFCYVNAFHNSAIWSRRRTICKFSMSKGSRRMSR